MWLLHSHNHSSWFTPFFMLHTITAAEIQAKGLKECVEPDAERNSMRWAEKPAVGTGFLSQVWQPTRCWMSCSKTHCPRKLESSLESSPAENGKKDDDLPARSGSIQDSEDPTCWLLGPAPGQFGDDKDTAPYDPPTTLSLSLQTPGIAHLPSATCLSLGFVSMKDPRYKRH